jgi:hypothetical protein
MILGLVWSLRQGDALLAVQAVWETPSWAGFNSPVRTNPLPPLTRAAGPHASSVS